MANAVGVHAPPGKLNIYLVGLGRDRNGAPVFKDNIPIRMSVLAWTGDVETFCPGFLCITSDDVADGV